MNEKKYLPIGSSIAGKYEVIDILGEDEFEILYLVRDIHRKKTFFVLKELFLETFSSREGELVFTIPEALGVFHKRKKEIIEEIKSQKLNSIKSEIKIYGYEDDNNTVYTIMEFSNNASLEKYLQFTPKDVKSLPTLDELLNKEKTFDYSLIFKGLFLGGVVVGSAFYAYTFFQKNSLSESEPKVKKIVTENFPKLTERKKEVAVKEDISVKVEETPIEVSPKTTEKVIEKIPEEAILEPIVPKVVLEENLSEESESNKSNIVNERVPPSVVVDTSLDEKLPKVEKSVTIEETHPIPVDTQIKEFLDKYIMASATSVEKTMKFYDKKVKKYFRFNHPSHKTIMNSQKRYNKKWVEREFKISDFKLVKTYQKNGVNYYNIKTTTVWHVRNKRGKKFSGKSRGFMTLKEVGDGFKITSIYALK